MDIDVVSLFKQGGIALVALVMLGWVIKRIGERMIISIDRLTERHDANAQAVSAALVSSTTTMTESLSSSTTTVTASLNRQSEVTVAALGGLTERVARVEGRIEGIAGRSEFEDQQTPVEHPNPIRKGATPAQGNPSLPYGLKVRPKTNG